MQSQTISAIGVNCVLLLMCWCDIKAAERSSTKPFIRAGKCVRVSDRQQVPGVPGQQCGPSPHVLLPPSPLPVLLLFSPFLLLSHSALFPFDQIQAKTCRAIYRRVVLFYQPVSICGTQKYRGLPGCWRQQCSAAEGWVEWERKGGKKDRKKGTKWQRERQKEGVTELEDAWHLVVARAFAWCLSGEVRRFISVCEMRVQDESTPSLCTCFSLIRSLWYNSRLHGKNWVVRIRSPSREAGLVEKRQPRCSLGKHRQQTQDTHWVIHHTHKHIHMHTMYSHTNKHSTPHTSHTDNPCACEANMLGGLLPHKCTALAQDNFTH